MRFDLAWDLPLHYRREIERKPREVLARIDAKSIINTLAKTSTVNKTSCESEYRSTCALLVSSGVHLNDVVLSPTSVWRKRKSHIKESAATVRADFVCPVRVDPLV